MCLHVEHTKTKAFKPKKGKKIELLKQIKAALDYHPDGSATYILVTPHRKTPIEAGWFKPEKGINKKEFNDSGLSVIYGGAIHAYLPSVKCKRDKNKYCYFLIKCLAYEEDVIAFGKGDEIAVEKLWIPLEEIERVTKLVSRRGYKI
jgi:hypothetical protein